MVGEKNKQNTELARLREENADLAEKLRIAEESNVELEEEFRKAKERAKRAIRDKEQYRRVMYRQGQEIQNHPFIVMRHILELFESFDPYTEGHSLRVTKYVVITAKAMGLPKHEVELVHRGGHMHDIGKLQWLKEYFTKKHLTEKEKERLREHTEIGSQYLETLARNHKEYKGLAPIAKYHHEHFGGISILTHPNAKYPGYPGELSGKNIPLPARITAVGDSLDAMTTDRGYKPKMAIIKALQEIRRCANLSYDTDLIPDKEPDTQFDPEITEAFLSIKTVGSEKTQTAHVIGCPELFKIDSLDLVINPSGFKICDCVDSPPEFVEYRSAA